MDVQFELPQAIAEQFRSTRSDLNGQAREVFLVDLYRQDRITHHQLAEALGLSRYETDEVLKKHQVWLELTPEELAAQAAWLQDPDPQD